MARNSLPSITAGEAGLNRYIDEIASSQCWNRRKNIVGKRYAEHGDRDAAHKLVTSHLRLVAKIRHGLPWLRSADRRVVSEGNVGLMQAVKKFDPDRGFRLATYSHVVDQGVYPGVYPALLVARQLGTTANQKRLFFNLRRLKGRLQAIDDGRSEG